MNLCLTPPQPSPTRGEGERRGADQHAVGEIDDVPIEQADAAQGDGLGDGPEAANARAIKPPLLQKDKCEDA